MYDWEDDIKTFQQLYEISLRNRIVETGSIACVRINVTELIERKSKWNGLGLFVFTKLYTLHCKVDIRTRIIADYS